MRGVWNHNQRKSSIGSGERSDHLAVAVMTSVEIVGSLVFFRHKPSDELMRIPLTVELNLGSRMQRVGRIEVITSVCVAGAVISVSGTGRRGSTMDGFAVESDCPQLLFSQECPAAAAGNWTIRVSQPCQFSNWQAN